MSQQSTLGYGAAVHCIPDQLMKRIHPFTARSISDVHSMTINCNDFLLAPIVLFSHLDFYSSRFIPRLIFIATSTCLISSTLA